MNKAFEPNSGAALHPSVSQIPQNSVETDAKEFVMHCSFVAFNGLLKHSRLIKVALFTERRIQIFTN